MAPARFEERVSRVRRSRRGWSRFFARASLVFALGPVALVLVAGFLERFGVRWLIDVALWSWLVGWLGLTPLSTVVAIVAGWRRRLDVDRIAVDDDVVRLEGRRAPQVIPRARVVGALSLLGHEEGVDLVLTDGDVIHVELAGGSRTALVAALGFGAAERRTVVYTGDDHSSLAAGCWGVVLGTLVTVLGTCGLAALSSSVRFVNQIFGFLIAALFVGGSLAFARLLAPKRIVVGTDGISVERAIGTVFLPISTIARVAVNSSGVVLETEDRGARRVVRVSRDTGAQAEALARRIEAALANARQSRGDEASALIARSGRSIAEWRAALRRLVAGAGDYRGERVSLDALLHTAESPEAPAEQRLGAALAIGASADEDAQKRLRVAVHGIANERLRVAMEKAAEGEEEAAAIEEALAAEEKARVR